MKQPDFSFPKNVSKESREKLDTLDPQKQPVKVIRTLIDLIIAEDLVSRENAPSLLGLVDSISLTLPSPYNALGHLLEANLYNGIYESDKWTYNSRTVDASMEEENPEFWDKKLFGNKIMHLTGLALSEKRSAEKMPLSEIEPIIEEIEDINDYTVYDFIVYLTLKLRKPFMQTSVIPFFKKDAGYDDFAAELITELIDLHSKPGPARTQAVLQLIKFKTEIDSVNILWKEIQVAEDTPFYAPLLLEFYIQTTKGNRQNNNTLIKDIYRLAADGISKYKESQYAEILQSIISSIRRASIILNYSNLAGTGTPVTVNGTSENINKFYVLLIELKQTDKDYCKKSQISSYAKLIDAKEITLQDTLPFQSTFTTEFIIKNPGKYAFITSYSPDLKNIISEDNTVRFSIFNVSDIDIINISNLESTISGWTKKSSPGIYVVDASNGAPIENAQVYFRHREWRRGNYNTIEQEKKNTDKSGYASTKLERADVEAEYHGSKAEGRVRWDIRYSDQRMNVRFFPDRSVCRPGEKIRFLGVVYDYITGNKGEINSQRKVTVALKNANRETVDTLSLRSDASGRIYGEFTIPQDGLLGSWMLQCDNIGTYYFEVAEYKTPTLLITLEKDNSQGDNLEFAGVVATYSGMPVANTKVSFQVNYSNLWFMFDGVRSQTYTSTVETDSEGKFRISLPTGNLDRKKYSGIFNINATATDEAGETVSSRNVSFWLRNSYDIVINANSIIECSGREVEFQVKVVDGARLPVIKKLMYEVRKCDPDSTLVSSGTFESPAFKILSSLLPSGKYKFNFKLSGEETKWTSQEIIIYRKDDKVPPVDTALWLPKDKIVVNPKDTAYVKFGCSYKGQHILIITEDSQGDSNFKWYTSDGKMSVFSVSAPADTIRKRITFIAFRDHNVYSKTVEILPKAQTENIEIKTETFRNLISPGQDESWKFSVTLGGKPIGADAFALLYDKAMDAILPLHWDTGFYTPSYYFPIEPSANGRGRTSITYGLSSRYYYIRSAYPQEFGFNTYGFPLYEDRVYFSMNRPTASMKLREASFSASNDIEMMVNEDRLLMENGNFEEDVEEQAGDEGRNMKQSEEIRPIEMPVGFFMPDLKTGADGSLDIDFTVPNFNTTWKFLLGAYTPDLMSGSLSNETVAQKKVMVKMNPPRFLRTGDKGKITATVYNNSDQKENVDAIFEVFNPLNGEVLKTSGSKTLALKPSANGVISVEFDCPDNISAVGLRVKGSISDSSDGEETVIPILPSSQPVVESEPFYLKAGTKDFSINVPHAEKNASVTFKYTDNPMWEVLTALCPIINPDSESLTAQIAALYSNCIGTAILRNNATLKEGLKMILNGEGDDKLLVSNLVKDPELKTVALNNTPWVNNAVNETLRLSRLGTLIDSVSADNSIKACWKKILQLQNTDGGWGWCKDMPSSRWMTQIVIINLGLIKDSGSLPDINTIDEAVRKGIEYCEKDFVHSYSLIKEPDKTWFWLSMQNYLFARSFFPEVKMDGSFTNLRRMALDYLENNWERESIFNKATLAIILWRDGRRMAAREVLASLRQFTSEDETKGVWFDNVDTDWTGAGKLLTTGRALLAFHEVNPSDSIIDGIRQWLLIQKQAQDWQEGLFSIDVINAIFSTGQDWVSNFSMPVIKAGDRMIKPSKISALTGSCSLNINFSNTKEEITISRSSLSPAWGGFISQYIAPMDKVREVTIPDLRISKEFWVVRDDENGEAVKKSDNFKIGDRVRVTLIIDCGRDMDFVALTDERPACLEPKNQLSGYTFKDGLWFYQETRNNATNIFFDYLPRGRHIVSYECSVMEAGEFASGIATLQCQYSPLLTAHSAGQVVRCE